MAIVDIGGVRKHGTRGLTFQRGSALVKTRIFAAHLTAAWLVGACATTFAAPTRDIEARATLGRGQTRAVKCLTFSVDGKTLVLGCEDGKVRFWDVATGAEKAVVQAHKVSLEKYMDSVNCVAFSADGKLLATAGDDKTVKLWDVDKKTLRITLKGHTRPVLVVAFHPDGKLLASCGRDETIRLWDATTGEEKRTLKGHDKVISALAFSPNGDKLYSGSWDHTIKAWDLATFKESGTFQSRTSGPWCLVFSPDGKTLASAGTDTSASSVQLWDVATQKAKADWNIKGEDICLQSVAWTADGQQLFTACGDKTIRLWEVSTGKQKAALDGHLGKVTCLAISPDGTTLASGGEVATAGGEVRLWDIQTAKEKAPFQDHIGKILAVTFSPDGKTIASGGDDKTVRLWDLDTGKVQAILNDDEFPFSLCFSPNGKSLAAGGNGIFSRHKIKLWDVGRRKPSGSLPPDKERSFFFSLAYATDGNTLAAARIGGVIEFWDLEKSAKIDSLEIAGQWRMGKHSLAQSADGSTIALAMQEDILSHSKITVWDLKTKKERTTVKHDSVNGIAFSPNGNILASGGQYGRIKLWDVETGKETAELTDKYQAVECIVFSPDGKTLASGHEDNAIRLWDVKTGNLLSTLKGHADSVWSVSFSPNGKTLASASFDGTVKLWDIKKE
jgi:WD40 repeat protein